MLRILYIAADCYPPTGPEALTNAKLALALLSAGCQVDVISNARDYQAYPNSIGDVWDELKKVTHIMDVPQGGRFNCLFEKAWYVLRYGYPINGIVWAGRAIGVVRDKVRQNKYDLIMSRTSHGESHLPALYAATKYGIPWIANWNDPYPKNKYPPPYGNGPYARINKHVEKYFQDVSRNATWHTFPSTRLMQYMAKYLPGIKTKSSIIPHIALDRFKNGKPNHVRNTEFTICYTGRLTSPRTPHLFLEGFRKFIEKRQGPVSVKLQFVGRSDGILEYSKAHNLDCYITDYGPLPFEESIKIAEKADVLLLIEAPCDEGIFLPSKLVDYLQIGLPVLAVSPEIGVLSDLLNGNGGGIAVSNQSSNEVADAIENMYGSWEDNTLEGRYNTARLYEMFNERTIMPQISQLFDKIINLKPVRN